MMELPAKVTIVEVAPRDGLQSLGKWIDTDTKVAMIDRLSEAGLPVIEVTGFAHPKVIPNLRDAEEVFARIKRRPGTIYRGLAPNARGATRAAAARVDEMVGLTIVSATYLRHNQNMTVDEGVDNAIAAFRIAGDAGIAFVMALGNAMWCPYEGAIPEEKVLALLDRLTRAGSSRFYLAGSMGMEDPGQVHRLFRTVTRRYPDAAFGYHVHNMAGSGTASVIAALDAGATFIEGACCGLGGGIAMPKTAGAVGNLPTEDLVIMLNAMGIDTGVTTDAMVSAARDVAKLLDIQPHSHALMAGTREDILEWGRKHPKEHPS